MTMCCCLSTLSLLIVLAQVAAPYPEPTAVSSPQDQGRPAPASSPSPTAGTDVNENPEMTPRPGAISGATDAELQAQIQETIGKEPSLRGDNVTVSVSANAIELAGDVGSGLERQTATRIARSYAGSKLIVNHIQVRDPAKSKPPETILPISLRNSQKFELNTNAEFECSLQSTCMTSMYGS